LCLLSFDTCFHSEICSINYIQFTRHLTLIIYHLNINSSDQQSCAAITSFYCEWDYNGLGIDYQLLAGPVFILVFTIVGVVFGILGDKYNRSMMLYMCTLVFGVAIILQGSVQNYWQLILLRMVMAAGESGCNPLATGIMSDIFPENKRALVMAIFNWGVYGKIHKFM